PCRQGVDGEQMLGKLDGAERRLAPEGGPLDRGEAGRKPGCGAAEVGEAGFGGANRVDHLGHLIMCWNICWKPLGNNMCRKPIHRGEHHAACWGRIYTPPSSA